MDKINNRIKALKGGITRKIKKVEDELNENPTMPIWELKSHEKTLGEKHEEYKILLRIIA